MIVQLGDTFESISRAHFGTAEKSELIRKANPGASSPPRRGSTLIIPGVRAANPRPDGKGTAILIDGVSFTGWTDVSFSRSMDSFGTFNFRSVWEPDNLAFRNVFKPFQFQRVALFENGDLLFDGVMMPPVPRQSASGRTVNVSGYSLPGVINDCTAPVSALPLESDGRPLNEIAVELLEPFGIEVVFDADPGATFDREAIKPTDKIFRYLINLAQQRKLVITDTPDGKCKFQQEVEAGRPGASLTEDGIEDIQARFNAQEYYSHISGQTYSYFTGVDYPPGAGATTINPHLRSVLRPFTFKPADTLGGDVHVAVAAKSGRMFANAASYSVKIPSWAGPNGDLWQPNTTVLVHAPGAMIYKPYEMLIRSVTYGRTQSTESATLELVLPGSFRGQIPDTLPWD